MNEPRLAASPAIGRITSLGRGGNRFSIAIAMPAPAGPITSMSETAQSARVLSQDPSVVFTVVIPGSRSVGGARGWRRPCPEGDDSSTLGGAGEPFLGASPRIRRGVAQRAPGMGDGCRDVDWSLVTERVLVNQLQGLSDGPVSVSGWVETVRDQKKVQFVILRDETGAVQLVNPATRPSPRTAVGAGCRGPGPHRLDLEPRHRHLPDGRGRAEARRAREARRRRDQDRRARHRGRRSPRDADRRRQRHGQAHGLALPRPPSAPQQPHLPRADHPRARDALVLDRARLHRGALAEAHGLGIRVQRRAVLARVLRRPDRLPRAVAAVLQADGAGRRLRQDLRDRPRLPRRPVVHLAPRDRVHERRRRDQLDRLARGRRRDAGGAARRPRSRR